MAQRFYPAVLERGEGGVFGVWFPDFPGVVAGGQSQEEAMAKAERALSVGAEDLAFQGQPLPEPTPFEAVEVPTGCDLVALVAVGIEPPDQSERVNVYLPRSLVKSVDRRASELGMSRSSFFGFAVTVAMSTGGFTTAAIAASSANRKIKLETERAGSPGQSDRVVIKKYANLRLYNTRSSAYVTLEHLTEMVKEGVDFVVYDATGEDVTQLMLIQIIFQEQSPNPRTRRR